MKKRILTVLSLLILVASFSLAIHGLEGLSDYQNAWFDCTNHCTLKYLGKENDVWYPIVYDACFDGCIYGKGYN